MSRTTRPTDSRAAAPAARRSSPWHAVSIVIGTESCAAARGLGAARHLSADAPLLPLPDCTLKHSCACAYKHHEDRRIQARRRDEMFGLRGKAHNAPDRRMIRGRREDDE